MTAALTIAAIALVLCAALVTVVLRADLRGRSDWEKIPEDEL
jgi:hypothetical protein